MEEQYVEMDLGILFYEQRQFREASGQFADGLRTIEAIAAITPEDRRTKEYVPEAIAWLADAQMSQGLLADAIGMRQRNIALLEQLFRQTGDVAYRQKLVPARRGLGNLYAMVGRTDDAIAQMSAAVDQAKLLVSYEPANANWLEVEYNAQLNLAQVLLLKRRLDDASAQTKAGCDTVNRLLAKDRTEANRRAGLRDCLLLRAQIALARNLPADAVQSAQQAIAAAKTVRSSDAVKDRFYLAKAYRVSGDAFQALADAGSARSAWTAALAALSPGVAERPVEMSEHALILRRLGREAEARPLSSRLQQMGYSSAA
jgi:tetratricopeptide (TPR) repeat protein